MTSWKCEWYFEMRCNEQACPEWTEWGPWSRCTEECGGGWQRRGRVCNQYNLCPGDKKEKRICNEHECSEWATWTDWGDCSVPCAGGVKLRTRACNMDQQFCQGDTINDRMHTFLAFMNFALMLATRKTKDTYYYLYLWTLNLEFQHPVSVKGNRKTEWLVISTTAPTGVPGLNGASVTMSAGAESMCALASVKMTPISALETTRTIRHVFALRERTARLKHAILTSALNGPLGENGGSAGTMSILFYITFSKNAHNTSCRLICFNFKMHTF